MLLSASKNSGVQSTQFWQTAAHLATNDRITTRKGRAERGPFVSCVVCFPRTVTRNGGDERTPKPDEPRADEQKASGLQSGFDGCVLHQLEKRAPISLDRSPLATLTHIRPHIYIIGEHRCAVR